jgi:protein phosphatase
VAAGRLTEDEIASHPMRHVLVSTLGVMAEYTLGRESGTLADGDAALVCSDGFYQELPAAWPGPNAQERPVQALLEDAVGQILTGPAPDNLSAAMVRAVRSRR